MLVSPGDQTNVNPRASLRHEPGLIEGRNKQIFRGAGASERPRRCVLSVLPFGNAKTARPHGFNVTGRPSEGNWMGHASGNRVKELVVDRAAECLTCDRPGGVPLTSIYGDRPYIRLRAGGQQHTRPSYTGTTCIMLAQPTPCAAATTPSNRHSLLLTGPSLRPPSTSHRLPRVLLRCRQGRKAAHGNDPAAWQPSTHGAPARGRPAHADDAPLQAWRVGTPRRTQANRRGWCLTKASEAK